MADFSISTDVIQHGDGMRAILARMLSRMGRSPWSTAAITAQTALASASRTANTFSSTIDCRGYKGIAATINWTTTDATQTLQLAALAGTFFVTDYTVGTSGALSVATTSRRTLVCYPGVANGTLSQVSYYPATLLNEVQLVVYHTNTNPVTYEVRYKLIP